MLFSVLFVVSVKFVPINILYLLGNKMYLKVFKYNLEIQSFGNMDRRLNTKFK